MKPQSTPKLNPVARAVEDSLRVDTSGDKELLSTFEQGWDDLNQLKDDLASTILNLVDEVQQILSNRNLLEQTDNRREEFDRLQDSFFSDVTNASEQIAALRAQHEGRSGPIASMDDLSVFTRLSLGYNTLGVELQALLAPNIASMVLLIDEALREGGHRAQDQQTAVDAVVTNPSTGSHHV